MMVRGPHLVLKFPLDVLFPLERDEPFDIFLDDGNDICDCVGVLKVIHQNKAH
jgi:hypothetical protein